MSMRGRRFVTLARRYLADRRALGFALRIAGRQLMAFARFADARGESLPLTLAPAVAWARAAKRPSPITWARRLEIVRPFARYLRQFDPTTVVPPSRLFGRAHRRLAPHVYTHQEVAAMLAQARGLGPAGGLRPAAVATVLGLLACAGLRVSEALDLHHDDVDFGRGLLRVRMTKFRKSRLVPLHPSAVAALRRYAELRDRLSPRPAGRFFFLAGYGAPLTYSKIRTAFRTIRIRLGWESPGSHRRRMQDLRHTFACRRLLMWHADGRDVERLVFHLSTYMGHAKVTDTYWYLSGFPELMNLVGQRFERFATAPDRGQP